MNLFAMFLIAFCSIGILACLIYIVYQLQKEKMEKYAEQKIAERLSARGKRTNPDESCREHKRSNKNNGAN